MSEALRESVGAASFKVPESLADILAALETTGSNKNTKFGREVAIRDKQETGPKESDEVRRAAKLTRRLRMRVCVRALTVCWYVQELEKRRTAEIEELDALLARCKAEVEKYEKAIATFIANIRQVYRHSPPSGIAFAVHASHVCPVLLTPHTTAQQTEADMLTEEAKKKELQDKYVVMKKTFDLLPDAENNIKQLQQISAASAQRLLELVRARAHAHAHAP
jgi:hypothetical protein